MKPNERPILFSAPMVRAIPINAVVGPAPHATNARVILATRRLMLGRVVAFEHVRGHSGIQGNERADELATLGRLRGPQPSLAIGAST